MTQHYKNYNIWHLIKFTINIKEQENTTHNKGEKNQSIRTEPEMRQIIESVDKGIKVYYNYLKYPGR